MILAIPIGMGDDVYKINKAYIKYVSGAGYDPVLVTPDNDLKKIVSLVDGLVLPGGMDLDPIAYGENNYGSYYCDPDKDKFERELLWDCIVAGKPVFGICRGFQLIAREYMHNAADDPISKNSKTTVFDRIGFLQHVGKHEMTGTFNLRRTAPHHFVEGRVDALYNDDKYERDRFSVNSMHHQAVWLALSSERLRKNNKVSQHMKALAWTDRGLDSGDEVAEIGAVCEAFIIEGWSKAAIMGVQWHPEELKDYKLLRTFFGRFEKSNTPEKREAAIG